MEVFQAGRLACRKLLYVGGSANRQAGRLSIPDTARRVRSCRTRIVGRYLILVAGRLNSAAHGELTGQRGTARLLATHRLLTIYRLSVVGGLGITVRLTIVDWLLGVAWLGDAGDRYVADGMLILRGLNRAALDRATRCARIAPHRGRLAAGAWPKISSVLRIQKRRGLLARRIRRLRAAPTTRASGRTHDRSHR